MDHSRKRTTAILLFIGLSVCGCSQQRANERLRLAFITCAVEAKFFEPVRKGINDAARMMDVECDFIGTEGVDIPAQLEMVAQAVTRGYDGIAVNIIDPEAFDDVISQARDADVSVLAFNVDDHATPNARLSSVNQRLYEAGQALAEHLIEHIPA